MDSLAEEDLSIYDVGSEISEEPDEAAVCGDIITEGIEKAGARSNEEEPSKEGSASDSDASNSKEENMEADEDDDNPKSDDDSDNRDRYHTIGDFEWFDDYDGTGGCDGSGGCQELVSAYDYPSPEHFDGTDSYPYSVTGPEQFVYLCRVGDMKFVEHMSDYGYYRGDVNIPKAPKGFMKRRPLSMAAIGGHVNIGKHLLSETKEGTQLFVPYADWHDNPMFIAIRQGHTAFVRLLLKHGWSPALERNKLCLNSIEQAARCGELEILRLLLEGDEAARHKPAGLWAELLRPMEDPICGPHMHRVRRAKLLFAALCFPNNIPIIDYLRDTHSIDVAQFSMEVSDQHGDYVVSQGFLLGKVAQLDLSSFCYANQLTPGQMSPSSADDNQLLNALLAALSATPSASPRERYIFSTRPESKAKGENSESVSQTSDNAIDEEAQVDKLSEESDVNNSEHDASLAADTEEWKDNYRETGVCDGTEWCFEKSKYLDDNFGDYEGWYPKNEPHQEFLEAVMKGNFKKVKTMWESQKHINEGNIDKADGPSTWRRALTFAILRDHLDIAEYLIVHCKSALFVPMDMHYNPMFMAIKKSSIKSVRFLLKHGWSPEVEGNVVCMTSLEYAARCGELGILKLLLEGAEDSANNGGEWRGEGLWAKLLLPPPAGAPNYPCYRAIPRYDHQRCRINLLASSVARPGNLLVMQYLVGDVGIKVEDTMDQQRILLAAARHAGNHAAIKLLFENHGFVSNQENTINMIVTAAGLPNNCDTIRYLYGKLQEDIEPSVKDKVLCEALLVPNNLQTISYLLTTVGCDINRPSIMEDMLSDPVNSIDYLIHFSHAIDVNAKLGKRGRSPLHIVVGNLRSTGAQVKGMDLAKALLSHGANPTVKDKYGVTPLHLTNAPTVIKLLCDAGADVMALDRKQASVLSFSHSRVHNLEKRTKGLKAKVAEGGLELVLSRDRNGMTAVQLHACQNSLALYKATLGISSDGKLPLQPHPAEVYRTKDSLLHHAIASNHANENDSLVSFLVASRKCLPTDVNEEGITALFIGMKYYGKLLLDNGWSPNFKAEGGTPFHRLLAESTYNQVSLSFLNLLRHCSGIPAELLKAFRLPTAFTKDGAVEEIIAAVEKAEEERDITSLMVLVEPWVANSEGQIYAHMVAERQNLNAINEAVSLFALIDARAWIINRKNRSKRLRSEVVGTKKGFLNVKAGTATSPMVFFTEYKNANSATPIDVFIEEHKGKFEDSDDLPWPTHITNFFEKLRLIQ